MIQGFLAALGGYSQGAVEQKRYNQQLQQQQQQLDTQNQYRNDQLEITRNANKDSEYNRLSQSYQRLMTPYYGMKSPSAAQSYAKANKAQAMKYLSRMNELSGITEPIDEASIFPEYQTDYSTTLPYVLKLIGDKFDSKDPAVMMEVNKYVMQAAAGEITPVQLMDIVMKMAKGTPVIPGGQSTIGNYPTTTVLPLPPGHYGPPSPNEGQGLAPQMDLQPSIPSTPGRLTYNAEGNTTAANNEALADTREANVGLTKEKTITENLTRDPRIRELESRAALNGARVLTEHEKKKHLEILNRYAGPLERMKIWKMQADGLTSRLRAMKSGSGGKGGAAGYKPLTSSAYDSNFRLGIAAIRETRNVLETAKSTLATYTGQNMPEFMVKDVQAQIQTAVTNYNDAIKVYNENQRLGIEAGIVKVKQKPPAKPPPITTQTPASRQSPQKTRKVTW